MTSHSWRVSSPCLDLQVVRVEAGFDQRVARRRRPDAVAACDGASARHALDRVFANAARLAISGEVTVTHVPLFVSVE